MERIPIFSLFSGALPAGCAGFQVLIPRQTSADGVEKACRLNAIRRAQAWDAET